MALSATTLNGGITATQNTVLLTSGTGVVVGTRLKVDDEFITVQDISKAPFYGVQRGQNSTVARAHVTGATVAVGNAGDFAIEPVRAETITYAATGAIQIVPGLHILKAAGVLAMTLAAPTAAQNGLKMTIISATAVAHTVTYTAGFNGAGGAGDVATFGGAIGDNFQIQAVNGIWDILFAKAVTAA